MKATKIAILVLLCIYLIQATCTRKACREKGRGDKFKCDHDYCKPRCPDKNPPPPCVSITNLNILAMIFKDDIAKAIEEYFKCHHADRNNRSLLTAFINRYVEAYKSMALRLLNKGIMYGVNSTQYQALNVPTRLMKPIQFDELVSNDPTPDIPPGKNATYRDLFRSYEQLFRDKPVNDIQASTSCRTSSEQLVCSTPCSLGDCERTINRASLAAILRPIDLDKIEWGVNDWRWKKDPSGTYYRSYVTSVKDQRNCGSCWAFSATTTMESQSMIMYDTWLNSSDVMFGNPRLVGTNNPIGANDPGSLSEQDVLNDSDGGCGGSSGYDAIVNTFIENSRSDGGIGLSLKPYPSRAPNGTIIKDSPSEDDDPADDWGFRAKAWSYWDKYNSDGTALTESQIRSYIDNVGPLGVYLWVCNSWGGYNGIGVYDDPTCQFNVTSTGCPGGPDAATHPEWCGADLGINHAVSIVGYGSQLTNQCVALETHRVCFTLPFIGELCFEIPTGRCARYGYAPANYWIVKNSWGCGWADSKYSNCSGGYMKMRSGFNIANIEKYIYRPVPALFDFTFAGFFPLPKPYDICFNSENHDQAIPTNIWKQAKCYTYLCYPNRTLIDTPNLTDSLLSSSHVPNGYCATRVQEFCNVAKRYCTYNGLGCSYIIPHTNTSWSDGGGEYTMNTQDSETILGAVLALLFGIKVNISPTAAQAPCFFYQSLCCPRFINIPRINLFLGNFNMSYITDQIRRFDNLPITTDTPPPATTDIQPPR